MSSRRFLLQYAVLLASLAIGATPAPAAKVGQHAPRQGDEIVVCGQFFHTTAPVVLWMDPGGYDAYRVERRFSPFDRSDWRSSVADANLDTPNRYGLRLGALSPEQIEKFRGGGWDLDSLREVVDQFVMHYDVCGVSRTCFKVLHDNRCLSVHFMLDIDGTIYQTLDLKERAWHATTSNTRSVGIEIANIGAYPRGDDAQLARWYMPHADGGVFIRPPLADHGIRTPNFVGRPARKQIVAGTIQGQELSQYDLTPEQYDSLIKLTATLCKVFPKIKCEQPLDERGKPIPHKLPDDMLNAYGGVLGHYHVQTNKTDPGPAFDWDKVINGAKRLMR